MWSKANTLRRDRHAVGVRVSAPDEPSACPAANRTALTEGTRRSVVQQQRPGFSAIFEVALRGSSGDFGLQIRSLNVPPARPSPLTAGCAAGELAVRSGDVPVAARSLSAICLLRSFSTVFAHAEALAATARSLRALVSRSTVGVRSAASASSTAAWVLWSFSTAVGDGFPAAGRPL